MSLNVIAIVLSAVTLGLVTYLLIKLRDQNTLEKGNSDHLQTKLYQRHRKSIGIRDNPHQ